MIFVDLEPPCPQVKVTEINKIMEIKHFSFDNTPVTSDRRIVQLAQTVACRQTLKVIFGRVTLSEGQGRLHQGCTNRPKFGL